MKRRILSLLLLLCLLLPFTAQAVTLQFGDSGADVEALQYRLIDLGYLYGTPHGEFEDVTKSALTDFQAMNNLTQDGIATDEVQAALYSTDALNIYGEPRSVEQEEEDEDGAWSYIGNKKTKKFHYPSCYSVGQMKDKNKVPLDSREEAISKGYVPCKKCNP